MTAIQPLTSFPRGSQVRIENFCAGNRARCRLCALGLTPGTTVVVDSASSGGACRLKVRGSDLVLGRGLAEKVLASPIF